MVAKRSEKGGQYRGDSCWFMRLCLYQAASPIQFIGDCDGIVATVALNDLYHCFFLMWRLVPVLRLSRQFLPPCFLEFYVLCLSADGIEETRPTMGVGILEHTVDLFGSNKFGHSSSETRVYRFITSTYLFPST